MTRWALALVVLSGCASPGSECSGGPRAIDECALGIAWADCGGTGSEPRLACRADGDCRWFANDCAAQDYEPSSCPASDVCCHADAPYDGPHTGAPRDFAISALTLGWGTEPWDRVRDRNVTVTVGATAAAVRPSVECADVSTLLGGSACGSASVRPSWSETGGVVIGSVVADAGAFAGHQITFELIPDATGTMGARVCSVPFSDAAGATCSPPDATDAPRACATSGTVRIDSLPATAHTRIDIDATFPDGSTVTIRI